MNPDVMKRSRVGFVVVKLSVGSTAYYLMRLNPKWRDVNFLGGHEKDRDACDLRRTAQRELWEEVPSIRGYSSLNLATLTPELQYGPVLSRSRGGEVSYDVQFFLLKIDRSPNELVTELGVRTKNVWVQESDLLKPGRFRMSGFIGFLEQNISGGIRAIPFSSPIDLHEMRHRFEPRFDGQLEFALK